MIYLLAIILLLFAIPVGVILRSLTKEEMKDGNKYFLVLWISCLILAGFFLLLDFEIIFRNSAVFTFLFIAIVSFISWRF